VGLLGLLANPDLQAALEKMVGQQSEDRHVPAELRHRQQQRRLSPRQIEEVVSRYVEGESIDSLARAFGINRTTVISHLERNGVQRRRNPRKMTDAAVQAAANRYASGLSLTAVAAEFDVCERTLTREFRVAHVVIRRRNGR
jgi:transposase-like protein